MYKAVHAGLGLQPDFLDAEIIAVDSRRQRLVMNFGMGVDAQLQVNFSQLDKHVLTACELDEALSPKTWLDLASHVDAMSSEQC